MWSTQKVQTKQSILFFITFASAFFPLLIENVIVPSESFFSDFQTSVSHRCGGGYSCVVLSFCFILNILGKNCNLILQWGSAEVSMLRRELTHDDLIFSAAPLQHVTASFSQCRTSSCMWSFFFLFYTILQLFNPEPLPCLYCPSCFFLIQTVAILGLISGEPQKCGLLTFRNAKLWSSTALCTYTHKQARTFQKGPVGVGNRKWSNLPLLVSELWFIHTTVRGNRCGKSEKGIGWGGG